MRAKFFQCAWQLLFLVALPVARAEDARLPYHELCRMQQAQVEMSRVHPNLALVLQMRSTNPNVKYSDLSVAIASKLGNLAIPIGSEGVFSVPVRQDLLAEDPWVTVNQPRGTMELNWHAGLAPALARQMKMTNAIHYGRLMRAVHECDEVQDAMHQFFPAAPRLTTVGLRLTFRASAIGPSAIIHARGGDRRLPANTFGELIIPFDADLVEEDPLMTVTESPIALEIVTRKSE